MNRELRILSGLHAGANTQCDERARYLIGSDPACAIVLCDDGVAAKHCLIAFDDFGMTCRAVEGMVTVDGREVHAGETVSIEDLQVIQCGPVSLSVGPILSDWSRAGQAAQVRGAAALNPMGSLKRINPYVLFAGVLLGMSGLLGLAYGEFSDAKVEVTPVRLEAARAWLLAIAPHDSELQINIDSVGGRHLVLSGYVASNQSLGALTAESRRSAFRPQLQVYAADELVASLSRLAQLAQITCSPLYKSAGTVECAHPVESSAVAARLQTIARDVPGLRELELHVAAPTPAVPVAPAALPAVAAPTGPPVITQKFAVLMFRGGRYLIDPYGQRYTEGEEFNGFKIRHIDVDEVIFEREGRQYSFRVAALSASVAAAGALR